MRFTWIAALSAACIFASGRAAPAASDSIPLDVAGAIREALEHSPELEAARQTIAVARGQRLQAGRLNNPELEIALLDDRAFKDEGERSAAFALAQRFPVASRLARERNVAAEDVAIAAAEVMDFVRTLVADVQRAFIEVRALEERIEVNRDWVETVAQVERATRRRIEAAEGSPAAASLLRIERLRLEQEGERLLRERQVAAASLARLLGRSGPSSIRLIGELEPDPATPLQPRADGGEAESKRPDLVLARAQVQRARADRALAAAEVWEDWTLGAGVERERQVFEDPIGTKRDTFLALDVTVPLPLWNRQEGRIAAAAAELRRAERSLAALKLRVAAEIAAARARVDGIRQSVTTYTEVLLPEVARAQELFAQGYRQGLVSISDLLTAQRQANDSRDAYVVLLAELRQALIDLEAAEGSSPYLAGSSQGEAP